MKTELKAQANSTIETKKTSGNRTAPTVGMDPTPPIAGQEELRYFDDVVLRARTGDRAALASVAVYLRPVLVRQAQKEMGPYAHDAEVPPHSGRNRSCSMARRARARWRTGILPGARSGVGE